MKAVNERHADTCTISGRPRLARVVAAQNRPDRRAGRDDHPPAGNREHRSVEGYGPPGSGCLGGGRRAVSARQRRAPPAKAGGRAVITPAQFRMARAALGWPPRRLAMEAQTSPMTI